MPLCSLCSTHGRYPFFHLGKCISHPRPFLLKSVSYYYYSCNSQLMWFFSNVLYYNVYVCVVKIHFTSSYPFHKHHCNHFKNLNESSLKPFFIWIKLYAYCIYLIYICNRKRKCISSTRASHFVPDSFQKFFWGHTS